MNSASSFRYHVGIRSLAEIATQADRVCVLNILGSESREVTPIGHAFSGGNVAFGTSPGRGGQTLQTAVGPIPVFNNVREGLEAGHRFNCGVVYLPPGAADDGAVELARVNPELKKIFIPTEKISVHDAREIRAFAQQRGIDVFGSNSLGVADSWNRVRIGGALGGDDPGAVLLPGTVAVFSNSGGFTTTIAQYLAMAGWGTTTLISSGKDIYIHYAAPEFAAALANDERSAAAVLYCEPGGYYELEAQFNKPVVACVVGRWKARLTRAVGHAGALAGGGDDAAAKERWFMQKFGVDALFTPDGPVFSKRGAVVNNIAYIPQALTAVMAANDRAPDFAPRGTPGLKAWFGSNARLNVPAPLDLPTVRAISPYAEEIDQLNRHVGASFARERMKDASGATRLDPATQVAQVHGVSVLDCAAASLESNLHLALLRERGGHREAALTGLLLDTFSRWQDSPMQAAAQASRQAGNAVNTVACAALATLGPNTLAPACEHLGRLLDLFVNVGLADAFDGDWRPAGLPPGIELEALTAPSSDTRGARLLAAVAEAGLDSVFTRWLRQACAKPARDAAIAAIAASLVWGPLMRRRISQHTARMLPAWVQVVGTGIVAVADRRGLDTLGPWDGKADAFSRRAAQLLLGREPGADELADLMAVLGLLLSNGPGTITAQGAKGAVSSDGPESPQRVQLNKVAIGALSHCGYAHGGNGFEGVAFLLQQFEGVALDDPAKPPPSLDLGALASLSATAVAQRKKTGRPGLDKVKVPCIHHPVFKGKPVNVDPRTQQVARMLAARGSANVFLSFFEQLVLALKEQGVTPSVYCVNVDAAIAALTLRLFWPSWRAGTAHTHELQDAAFALFVMARLVGSAAEGDDHLNRGRDMDTRTDAAACRFVA